MKKTYLTDTKNWVNVFDNGKWVPVSDAERDTILDDIRNHVQTIIWRSMYVAELYR